MEKKLHCGDLFKRVLSLAMALVMLLSFAPVPHAHAADGTTVYFSADHWAIDGARFAAYYFGGNMSPDNGWVSLTATEDAGVYTGVIPSGYTSVIFCRMNGSSTANSWDNRWNQTADLTLPTDGKNHFIVSEGAWDGANGTWTTYTPAQPDEPVTEATYVVTGDASLCGSNWDPTDVTNNKMELKDGLYTKTYSNVSAGKYSFKITDGKAWEEGQNWGGNGANGNYEFMLDTASNVTITFNAATKAINVTTVPVESGDDTGDDEPVVENTYVVAGDKALCGSDWNPTDTANQMAKGEDGKYAKTYKNVVAGTYSLKVVENGSVWHGDEGNNVTFAVSATCDVTVTFDASTKKITVTGDNVGEAELEITNMYAVGTFNSWNLTASPMNTDDGDVYEITLPVVKGKHEFKFAANGAWTHSWGLGTVDGEAKYGTQTNIPLEVTYDAANVTLKLDLTNYNHETGNGATYSVTMTKAEVEPTVDYYLVGNINGKDYTGTDYKFENGELTVTFDSTSYVAVKTSASDNWYMTNDWLGEVTSATLYDGSTLAKADKLMVPGGKALTFTLVDNKDGTLTLSYAPAEPEIPEEWTKVTIHFLKPETWGSSINAYVWATGAVPGYEDYNTWPGKAVKGNADHAGWYDLVVATEKPTDFNFIFNDGGNQTADLSTGKITGDTELWVVGKDVMTTAPGEWTGDYDYTANIYFQKPEAWGAGINAYIWNNGAVPGYEDYNTWPGKAIDADTVNAGWYNVSVTMDENTGFKFILNDGTNQTADLETGELQVKTDIWVVNGKVQKTAPKGWVDPNRTVHVPGTFPGPSWDAASNQMTYDPELGLYVYTFKNVPPANYEFKIAINGSWNENYGVGGVKDGSNIAVAVPETMPVTVYYNDKTHNAVTSVSYKFVEVSVSGTGIETTALTDEGLTGIYSGTVAMAKGIYTDVVITCDGKEYKFNEIEVEEDKDVTFYIDPVTGIFYCDASGIPVKTEEIYFNSQDEAYKAPFGAVAAGEDISFSIKTGEDVTSAVLVIKGLDSYPMEKNEKTGLWSCTASVANIGEYDYYFVVSNGSAVAIYGDDDGYYGEGTVTDLVSVMPYDLVVHKAGFETPDWMKNAVVYQIFPDRFFDGDESNNQAQTWARGTVDYEYITDWYTLPENPEQKALLDKATYESTGAWYGDGEWSNEIYGGDLEGITERIDYLKALGVNVIYLNPVFWSISNHRYDAVDYTKIDPILGTLGDFEELVAVAEANGMHIILDGVFNHVSDDSVYFDRYYKFLGKSEKIGAYPYWAYVYDYMAENEASQAVAEDAAKTYFGENYGITDYSYTEWFKISNNPMIPEGQTSPVVDKDIGLRAGKPVYSYEGWWGYDSMPVIKSTKGSEYQTGNWAEEIISGKNSVNAYWITKGMDGWRLDVANEVSDETWQNFRDSVKALNSDAVIIGEIWDDATKYLKGDMYDSVMNYLFRNAVTGFAMGTSSVDTTKAMEKIRERYPEEAFYAMMNLVGSHDTTRILSYLDGIGDDRNQKDFDHAFPTYANTSQTAKDRQYLVAFLQFTYAGAPTIYYGDEIGMVGADDPDDRRAFEWGKGNKELVEWYAKLAAIREAYPSLRTGSVQPIDTRSDNLMGFSRTLNDQTLIVVANNSANEQKFVPENAYLESYVDLISGKTYVATDSSYTVPAYSGIILVAADEVENLDLNLAGLAPAYDESYIVAKRQTPAAGEETHSHKYGEDGTVVEPTCTEQGYTSYTCECGDVYMTDFVKPTGHDYTETVTEPTCTEKGYTTYTCSVCEDTYTDDEVDALGHNFVESVTNPTCTETGKTLLTCEGCGECVISKEVDALGHNYEGGACTRCGEDDPNSVPSTPITPAKPNWKNWLDKIFNKWWDKDEKPEEPSEPETEPTEPETEPTEPEETEPEQTVPSKPITPAKPIWSNIIKKIFGWWKK